MNKIKPTFLLLMLCWVTVVHAGFQKEEDLADSVRMLLRQSVSQQLLELRPFSSLSAQQQFYRWRSLMQSRLVRYVAEPREQELILNAVDYEAHRAGLEPSLVLGVMMVESHFQKSATSPAGALGLMQVMPFWAKAIGDGNASHLFRPRVNIRFGCVILRHYLDKEKGDLVRALARYNGSLGQTHYAQQVLRASMLWR